MKNIRVVICPTDFRRDALPAAPDTPLWTATLYTTLREALREYASAPSS